MEPLKTLKGSKIWYSKFGVGKQVGSKVYVVKGAHYGIIPTNIYNKALNTLMYKGIDQGVFNTLCYDFKKPHIVRFDTCEGFGDEREPIVGWMIFVDTKTGEVWNKYNSQCYHHKWMWVPEDYDGFDVQASYEWSKYWLGLLPEVASGHPHKWEEQLKKYNII